MTKFEVELHLGILAKDGVHSYELYEGGGGVKLVLVRRQPIVVKVSMLAPQRTYDFVDEVVHQVFQVRQRGVLPFLNIHEFALICLVLGLGFSQLGDHFVVPLFDTFKHALVFIVLVLANLLFSLLDLFLLE